MNNEMKVRSFRISDSVAEKFKAFCGEFDNQSVALDSLISAYEVQNARAILTERQTDIADYDTHIQAIQSAFLRSLELNENAEQRIRAEFNNVLNSKDQIIVQLQAEQAQANEQAEYYKNAHRTLTQSTDEQIKAMQGKVSEKEKIAQNATERADTEQKAREQAETISAMLSDQVEQLKRQLMELETRVEQAKNNQQQAEQTSSELSQELASLKSAYSEMQRTLSDERASKERELAIAEQAKETAVKCAVAETAEKYQRKIEELQTKQAEQLAMFLQNAKN